MTMSKMRLPLTQSFELRTPTFIESLVEACDQRKQIISLQVKGRIRWRPCCPLKGWVIGVLCLLLSGCGDAPQSKLVPISGVVTMDGRPLVNALVEFEPVPGRAGDPTFNPSSTGTTDEEGRFSLDTPFGSGAVVGEHTVKIWEAVKVESEEELPPEEQIQLELLSDFGEKGRPFTVPTKGTDEADFVIHSAPTVEPHEKNRLSAADLHVPTRTPTRGHPGPSQPSGPWTFRTLWCAITIGLWLMTLVGCYRWWKVNERRQFGRS